PKIAAGYSDQASTDARRLTTGERNSKRPMPSHSDASKTPDAPAGNAPVTGRRTRRAHAMRSKSYLLSSIYYLAVAGRKPWVIVTGSAYWAESPLAYNAPLL